MIDADNFLSYRHPSCFSYFFQKNKEGEKLLSGTK